MKIFLIAIFPLISFLKPASPNQDFKNFVPGIRAKENTLIDTNKINELKKNFRVKKVESDPTKQWYYHQTTPTGVYYNWVSCYFRVTDNQATEPLRLRVQCHGEKAIVFKRLIFVIDGQTIEYKPSSSRIFRCESEECEEDPNKYWEYCEETVLDMDMNLIKTLYRAKSAEVKFVGSLYSSPVTITSEEIAAFRQTIDLYLAFGGKL